MYYDISVPNKYTVSNVEISYNLEKLYATLSFKKKELLKVVIILNDWIGYISNHNFLAYDKILINGVMLDYEILKKYEFTEYYRKTNITENLYKTEYVLPKWEEMIKFLDKILIDENIIKLCINKEVNEDLKNMTFNTFTCNVWFEIDSNNTYERYKKKNLTKC